MTDHLKITPRRRPSLRAAAALSVALILAMACLRVAVYPYRMVPLTYSLPLLIGLWHGNRRLLWGMAASFMLIAVVKVGWLVPEPYFDDYLQQFLFAGMQWLSILVPAAVIHLVLNYRERLEGANSALARANAELQVRNEELAAREAEISSKNEELEAQSEELEAKNKELQETQRRLEAYRDRYIDLYDFAPVGYVTLDEDGYVQEINLAGAAMLGKERAGLIGHPMGDYVPEQDKAAFLSHLRQSREKRTEVVTELSLIAKEGQPLAVQLRSTPPGPAGDEAFCKTAIVAIAPSKGTG